MNIYLKMTLKAIQRLDIKSLIMFKLAKRLNLQVS